MSDDNKSPRPLNTSSDLFYLLLNMSDTFPILQTERLDLVAINDSHAPGIFKLFGDERVTKYYNIVTLTEQKETQKIIDWFQTRFAEKAGIRWGISLRGSDDIIGTIGFNNYTKQHRANIGYDLQFEHWGQGYAAEALAAVINYGFTQLDINRIEAEVMQGNTASEKLLEKMDFKKEGILRGWMKWNDKHYDMTMFSLLRAEYNMRNDNQK